MEISKDELSTRVEGWIELAQGRGKTRVGDALISADELAISFASGERVGFGDVSAMTIERGAFGKTKIAVFLRSGEKESIAFSSEAVAKKTFEPLFKSVKGARP